MKTYKFYYIQEYTKTTLESQDLATYGPYEEKEHAEKECAAWDKYRTDGEKKAFGIVLNYVEYPTLDAENLDDVFDEFIAEFNKDEFIKEQKSELNRLLVA